MPRSDPEFVRFDQRAEPLRETRNLKMAGSAHAYVRGNTFKFYEWLDTTDRSKIPEGPPIWICGDCHVGNLGPIADTEGNIDIQIRDLDQTVIGNPAHDLIRLGLSLATAARGSDLPGVTTARMIEQMVLGYEEALAVDNPDLRSRRPECVDVVMKQAVGRTWRHLANERLEDTKPTIPLGKKFWPLSPEENAEIERIFATEDARRLVTSLRSRKDTAAVEVLDAAYWMKGCSSLGRLRFAVLLQVGKNHRKKGGLCLIDIKEATQAAAPRNAQGDHAAGQRAAGRRGRTAPFTGPGRTHARGALPRSRRFYARTHAARPQAGNRRHQPRRSDERGALPCNGHRRRPCPSDVGARSPQVA